MSYKNVVAFGPYIGNFEQEVLMFRPYIEWTLKNVDEIDYVVISSHFNRKFLYEGLYDKFIPVYKQLSRRETLQSGYIHEDVKQKDYVVLTKSLRDKVSELTNISKKNVEIMSVPYIRCSPPISIYNRSFSPIQVPINNSKCNVIFIPDMCMNEELSYAIYNELCKSFNVTILGDTNCNLSHDNEILGDIDYLNNGYFKMITAITNSVAVVTPCSHWTAICNIQKIPVISWGDTVGPYKEGGIYHLGNKKSRVVYHDDDSKVESLLNQINGFLNQYVR